MTAEDMMDDAVVQAVALQEDILNYMSDKDQSVAVVIIALGMAFSTATANYKMEPHHALQMMADMLAQANKHISSQPAH